MTYLLDVSFLIALAHASHTAHERAARWYLAHRDARFLVCSVVEMGFLRVSVNAKLQTGLASARETLEALRSQMVLRSVPDSITAPDLPDLCHEAQPSD